MPVDSSILDAMMSPFTQGAPGMARNFDYSTPLASHYTTPFNQQQQSNGRGPMGVYSGGGPGWGGYQFPTDVGNALNARGVQFGQDLKFLGDPRFSSLLNTLRSPLGNIGFQTNFGQSASLAPTPAAHA